MHLLLLYTGTPGSGKSLHVARVIRNFLRDGKPVIANFPINPSVRGFEHFSCVANDTLSPDYLYSFAARYWAGRPVREDRILFVVDEAQIIFNARSWSQGDRAAWLRFFSQHRHFGYSCVLVTQFDRMIDRQIRCLAEYEVIHRKVSNIGLKGRIVSVLAGGNLFVSVRVFYGMREKVGSDFFRGSRKLFALYDSYVGFGGDGAALGGAEGRGQGVPDPMAARPVPSLRDRLARLFALPRRGFYEDPSPAEVEPSFGETEQEKGDGPEAPVIQRGPLIETWDAEKALRDWDEAVSQ